MARILVVDDEVSVVQALSRALDRLGHTVVAAYDAGQALLLLRHQTPDLVILDVRLPGMSGLQLCRFIRTSPRLASVPVLILSVKGQPEDRIAGLEAGADDYLGKPFNLTELELRVKALLRRARAPSPHTSLTVGPLRFDAEGRQALLYDKPLGLTPVEFELLYYLARHAGETLSAERLLQEVWNYPPGAGNQSLVRMHVLNLRHKLEEDPAHPVYLCNIPRHGYTLRLPQGDEPAPAARAPQGAREE